MGRKLALLVCATALIGGCATPPATTPGTGSGAAYLPLVDMQGVDPHALAADVAACRDTASSVQVIPIKGESSDVTDALVLGVGLVVPFGFVGMAVISGIASGIVDPNRPRLADDPLQQKTLVNCMARKGYRNLDPNVSVAYAARLAEPVAAPRNGRDTYMAESFAKANMCEGSVRTVLEGKGPGFERYSVACGNGKRFMLRCEFGNCAPESLAVASGE
ncbi:hypothetical protein [Variovorax sp. OV329]|uniref:hypothetical protein n=1 Tax=Variovorax sp. OV329 TaxID=1882825 RepID=UPI0008F14FEB|nr:hypothetical protein [Variovorax sp. OV329]SFM34362.1 hypothetical protein SAMN05444747_104394 [Variovorax sp. OV329]